MVDFETNTRRAVASSAIVFPFRHEQPSARGERLINLGDTAMTEPFFQKKQIKLPRTTFTRHTFDFDKLQTVYSQQFVPSCIPKSNTCAFAKAHGLHHVGAAWVNEESLDIDGNINTLLNLDDHNGRYNYYSAHFDDVRISQSIKGLQLADAMRNLGSLGRLEPVMQQIIQFVARDDLCRTTTTRRYRVHETSMLSGDRFWLYIARKIIAARTVLYEVGTSDITIVGNRLYLNLVGATGGTLNSLTCLGQTCRFLNNAVLQYYFTRMAFAFNHPAKLTRFLACMERRFEMLQDPVVSLSTVIISINVKECTPSTFLAVQRDFEDMPTSCDEREWSSYLEKIDHFSSGEPVVSEWRNVVLARGLRQRVTRGAFMAAINRPPVAHQASIGRELHSGRPLKAVPVSTWLAPLQILLQRYKITKLILGCPADTDLAYGPDNVYRQLQTMLGPKLTKPLHVFTEVGGWKIDE